MFHALLSDYILLVSRGYLPQIHDSRTNVLNSFRSFVSYTPLFRLPHIYLILSLFCYLFFLCQVSLPLEEIAYILFHKFELDKLSSLYRVRFAIPVMSCYLCVSQEWCTSVFVCGLHYSVDNVNIE